MSKILKRISAAVLGAAICMTSLAACAGNGTAGSATSTAASSSVSDSQAAGGGSEPIVVICREDGSGTRGAFTELFGLEEKQGDTEVDITTQNAQITNSTGVMMTTVAGNVNAIGYISLGSLNDTVKALKIDGTEATTANVKNGSYKIVRPFNIATKSDVSEAAKDFIAFIQSAEGQEIIAKEKYIGVNDGANAFKTNGAQGKVVIAGSSSVAPLIESLKEEYTTANPGVTIEVQVSDSTTGMNSLADGICEIGMASRELKDSEIEKGLRPTVIAQDGIAVVVNTALSVNEIMSETVTGIYKGEITTWDKVA